jgi:hypothetical protein
MEWPGFKHYKDGSGKPEDDTTDEPPLTQAAKLLDEAVTSQFKANTNAIGVINIIPSLSKADRAGLRQPLIEGLEAATQSMEVVMRKLWAAINE